jgi:hypothetical protein
LHPVHEGAVQGGSLALADTADDLNSGGLQLSDAATSDAGVGIVHRHDNPSDPCGD